MMVASFVRAGTGVDGRLRAGGQLTCSSTTSWRVGSAGVFLEDLLRRHFFRLVHVFQTRAVKTKLAGLKKRLSDWADDSHSHHTVQ